MLKNKILSDELRDETPCSNLCAFRCGAIINPGLQKASINQRSVEGGDGAAFNCTLTLAVRFLSGTVELKQWKSATLGMVPAVRRNKTDNIPLQRAEQQWPTGEKKPPLL